MPTGKPAISMLEIEAYALPSSSYVPNDSHVFVVDKARSLHWANHGRDWRDGGSRTLVASTRAYKEWLLEFAPTGDVDKCGLAFGYNGVCHTYANRELLVAESSVCAKDAAKDYVCVFFFGKYGMGLGDLKTLLTNSYNKVMQTYSDPYNALPKVLARVDDYICDELEAWRKVAIEYGKIDIDGILAKDPAGGKAVAKRRLTQFITERETIYQQNKSSKSELRKKLKAAILAHSTDYLDFLLGIKYITQTQKTTYLSNVQTFLNGFTTALAAQEAHLTANGVICETGLCL